MPASLAGNVFKDFGNDGALNGPDTALAGVTVKVSGGSLTTPQSATTDTSKPSLASAASSDGKLVALACQDKQTRIVNTADGKLVKAVPTQGVDVTGVSVTNDGQRVAVATTTGSVRVVSLDGQLLESVELGAIKTTGVGFSLDQKSLVVTSDDPRVRVVRLSLQKKIHVSDKPLTGLAYSADGASLLVGGEGQPVTVWNLATGMAMRTIAAPGVSKSMRTSCRS